MPDLIVESVGLHRLAEIYPLIRSATRVSLERWEEFSKELLAGCGGVLAVTAPDDCIHGAAAYRAVGNLRHQRSLDVEVIVAFELRGDDRVRKLLCHALEKIAADLDCSAVNFTVEAKTAERSSRAREGLERLGLRLDTAGFVRELPGRGARPGKRLPGRRRRS
jgi:hypothetical protein